MNYITKVYKISRKYSRAITQTITSVVTQKGEKQSFLNKETKYPKRFALQMSLGC